MRCGCGRDYMTLALGEECCQPFGELDTTQGRQLPLPLLSALVSGAERAGVATRHDRGLTDAQTRRVIRLVLRRAGVTLEDVLPNTRRPAHDVARRAAMLEAWGRGASYSSIGRVMHRDHSTVHKVVARAREAVAA